MKTIIYRITVKDVQDVAMQEFNTVLTPKDIRQIEDLVGDRISWYDAVTDSIVELFRLKGESLEANNDEEADLSNTRT